MQAIEYLSDHIWRHPPDYAGFSPDGDYCVLSLTRDSSILEKSNWKLACRDLDAGFYAPDYPHYGSAADDYPDRPNAYTFRANHWACGWVEYLMVRHDAPEEVLTIAGELVASLEDYPCLDESDYSDMQWIDAQDCWEHLGLRDRIELCSKAGVSIFASRRFNFPSDDQGYIIQQLAGD